MPLNTFMSVAFFAKAAIIMKGLKKRDKLIWPCSATSKGAGEAEKQVWRGQKLKAQLV